MKEKLIEIQAAIDAAFKEWDFTTHAEKVAELREARRQLAAELGVVLQDPELDIMFSVDPYELPSLVERGEFKVESGPQNSLKPGETATFKRLESGWTCTIEFINEPATKYRGLRGSRYI